MAADDVCTVRARMSCLPEAIAFVEAICGARAVAGSDCLRLSLVVEELFTNTVTHGHGGDSDATMRIGLRVDASFLELSYEDGAPPFDPLDHVARSLVDPAADVADRPVGQLGLSLVVSMAERAAYVRVDGCNRVQLALRRHATIDTPADPA